MPEATARVAVISAALTVADKVFGVLERSSPVDLLAENVMSHASLQVSSASTTHHMGFFVRDKSVRDTKPTKPD